MNAAAYARYSTDHQTQNSIAYQLDAIRSYCREHRITIVATYTDEADMRNTSYVLRLIIKWHSAGRQGKPPAALPWASRST